MIQEDDVERYHHGRDNYAVSIFSVLNPDLSRDEVIRHLAELTAMAEEAEAGNVDEGRAALRPATGESSAQAPNASRPQAGSPSAAILQQTSAGADVEMRASAPSEADSDLEVAGQLCST